MLYAYISNTMKEIQVISSTDEAILDLECNSIEFETTFWTKLM